MSISAWLAFGALQLLHLVYFATRTFYQLYSHLRRRPPQPLSAPRKKIPTHLAIAFAVDRELDKETKEITLLESVERVSKWSREVGIEALTIYDEEGVPVHPNGSIYMVY